MLVWLNISVPTVSRTQLNDPGNDDFRPLTHSQSFHAGLQFGLYNITFIKC